MLYVVIPKLKDERRKRINYYLLFNQAVNERKKTVFKRRRRNITIRALLSEMIDLTFTKDNPNPRKKKRKDESVAGGRIPREQDSA